ISEAYDVLKDEQKRAAYDRFGHQAFEGGMGGGQAGGGFGGGNPFGFDFSSSSFSDIFDEMFGAAASGSARPQTQTRGADMRYNLDISLEEAFKGCTKKVKFTGTSSCDSCHGTGGEGGSQPVRCKTCGGRGKVRTSQGFFTIERTCTSCQGMGQTIDKPCKKCSGQGRVRKEKNLDVKIPAGVDEGTRIRLSGEGEAGLRGGASGDLYVFISLTSHRFFKRVEKDLHCRVPISMVTASLGGEIEVPSIEGTPMKVKIPSGTQTSHNFRLKGKGMSVLRASQRGDMYIEAIVETPMNLTKKQKELLEEFEKAGKSESTSPESSGFFKKVKEIWGDLGGGSS
ncbi:MAG TPA: molecular chaperone DnaJ, partial [Alphaproteobacteria bacterium]|nr:molecular chaperone DnaJ [Alphaproteobacteria bacterium]